MACSLEKVYLFITCLLRPESNINVKIREVANSADYDPSPTPSHGPGPSPLEATHTPPRSVPEPQRIPTVTLWDPKTGKQIYTPPKTSPVGRRMGTTLSKPPKAPTTPAFLGPTIGTFYPSRKGPTPSKAPTTPAFPGPLLGTFYPSGKPPIRVLHPNNASKVGHTQKGNEPEVDSQETNQEHREDSQETDDIEGLIKDIQQPLEGIMLNALEPDSQVSRDQAMAGSVHAAQMVALLNASPDKLKGMSFGQLVEPARARHTKEELAAAGNLGRRDLIDEGARK